VSRVLHLVARLVVIEFQRLFVVYLWICLPYCTVVLERTFLIQHLAMQLNPLNHVDYLLRSLPPSSSLFINLLSKFPAHSSFNTCTLSPLACALAKAKAMSYGSRCLKASSWPLVLYPRSKSCCVGILVGSCSGCNVASFSATFAK
jgi:hypothetical protein